MSRNKYKFTNKKHSIGGVVSSVMALCAIGMLALAIFFSFQASGNGGTRVGALALLATAFALFGLIIGLSSYREFDRYYTFSKIGSLLNGIIFILLIMLLLAGI